MSTLATLAFMATSRLPQIAAASGLFRKTALAMKPCTSAAISSAFVSSAKCPASSTCTLSVRHILAVAFRLAEVEREIVLAPEHQKPRLRLLHPRLPLRIGIDIRAVVVEEIALNLRLPWCVQKGVFIRPEIRVVELNRSDRLQYGASLSLQAKEDFCVSASSCAGRSAQNARRVAQFAPRPSLCATASWTMSASRAPGCANAMRKPTGPP